MFRQRSHYRYRWSTYFACWVLFIVFTASVDARETVDSDRIATSEHDPDNWLSFGRGYHNRRFSPLDQINTETVRRLVPKWIFQSGKGGSFQTQPLINDGTMFATLPGNDVVALNAETGTLLWRYRHKNRRAKTKGGPANRGAALAYGKVFTGTNDGRLIALDADTGAVAWDTLVAQPLASEIDGLSEKQQQTLRENVDELPIKMAPLVYDELAIVGVTSAGYGMIYNFDAPTVEGAVSGPDAFLGKRGYIAAFDVHSGEEKWRWFTTQSGAWEGAYAIATVAGETLPRDIEEEKRRAPAFAERWQIGGSSTWMTPAFDPELGLIYLGTGNASPNDIDGERPGDNLYANSLVAIDAQTGETRWHYQQVPHDLWGYDVASTAALFTVEHQGATVPAVGIAGKTGWFYVHETGAAANSCIARNRWYRNRTCSRHRPPRALSPPPVRSAVCRGHRFRSTSSADWYSSLRSIARPSIYDASIEPKTPSFPISSIR